MSRNIAASPALARGITVDSEIIITGTYPGATTFPGSSGAYPGPAVYPGATTFPATSLYPGQGDTIVGEVITPRTITETPA